MKMMRMIDKRIHKFKCHYGMGDYYSFYNKKYKNVNRNIYGSVISDFNKAIGKLIIEENLEYTIPKLYFELILRKDLRKPRIENGKLINNIPIDWKKTNELWDKSPSAKEKKLLVRYNNSHTFGFIYRIYFKKFKAKMKYRSLFKFQINRDLKRSIAKKIKNSDKQLDAYLLYEK